MLESGLSPFTNRWHAVHDFTPETSTVVVTDDYRPDAAVYGVTYDWTATYTAERVSTTPADSYFLHTSPPAALKSRDEVRSG